MKTLTSRDYNRNSSGVLRAAEHEPVFITRRGTRKFVVTTVEDYYARKGEKTRSIGEALSCPEIADIEFDIPPRAIETQREIDLD